MKISKVLNEIYYEQKEANRQLQRLSNSVLIGILAMLYRDAKNRGDEGGKKLCTAGFILALAAEVGLMILGIMDRQSKRMCQEFTETEDGTTCRR